MTCNVYDILNVESLSGSVVYMLKSCLVYNCVLQIAQFAIGCGFDSLGRT